MSAKPTGPLRVLRAVADSAGWPWCGQHHAPRWHGSFACAHLHENVDPAAPAWCYTCERMHGPMEWGDGCCDDEDLKRQRAAELAATCAAASRRERRYKISANTVEATACLSYVAMAVTAVATTGWVLPAACLVASLAGMPVSWRLHRRSAEAQQQALDTQREAVSLG